MVEPVASLSTEGLIGELSAHLKKLKFTPSPVVISFPRNLVTMRNLHLPSQDPKEIENMIELHMGRQVPYPREEIVSSYQILGTDESGYSKVLLAISHRETLHQVFNILGSVNIFPERVELSSQGVLSNLLVVKKISLESGKIYILLDIDANFTDFMIIDKDNMLFSRSIACGAEQIMVEQILNSKFIPELKQSLIIFQSEEQNKKPTKVYVTGATENLKGLKELLEKELGVEADVLSSDTRIPKNVSVSSLLGLGVDSGHRKRINFVLPEVQIRRALKDRGKELIVLGSVAMFALAISCGIFLEKMYTRSAYLKMLDERYQQIGEDIDKLSFMAKKSELTKEKLASRGWSLNYLYQIHKLIPPDVVLKMINFEADNLIVLRGQARTQADAIKFTDILNKSGYFKDIETKYINIKKLADGEIAEFEFSCPMTKGKKVGE